MIEPQYMTRQNLNVVNISMSLYFVSSYTWFVPMKWIKSGVEQQPYWLLQKTGMTMTDILLPVVALWFRPQTLLQCSCFVFYFNMFLSGTNNQMRVFGKEWVLANTNVSGYYRVNYDLDNWDRLLTLLDSNHRVSNIYSARLMLFLWFNPCSCI